MRSRNLYFLPIVLLFSYCTHEMPFEKDGSFNYTIIISDSSGIFKSGTLAKNIKLSNAKVMLEYLSYFEDFDTPKKEQENTDLEGKVSFQGLPAGTYTISTRKDTFYVDETSGNEVQVELSGYKQIEISAQQETPDTLFTNLNIKASVVINEIYYCGPPNRAFYFYDQFVELYNTTDETVYLDGMILCRARQDRHINIDTNDFLQAIYVFQFPGTVGETMECPLEPGAFTVVAGDAVDHSEFIDTALDLSMAEWEFFNPYGAEPDNAAKNVTNILIGERSDFMINLSHNAVILAYSQNPENASLKWYYGETKESNNEQYVHVPLVNVIDVVEYASSFELQKEITIRADAGFAGVGMTKYSGKSVERKTKGFDTNNSSLDFEIIDTPTPGYQHQ
jgi:hypothetical protein